MIGVHSNADDFLLVRLTNNSEWYVVVWFDTKKHLKFNT